MVEVNEPGRRAVLRGALVVGAALGTAAVAGCGKPAGPGVVAGAGTVAPAPPGDPVLGTTEEVPVGGGKVFAGQRVVVTQPTAGTFVGLSAVCTHQGCIVGAVTDGVVVCPCHGSRFRLDGAVAAGPATRALDAVPIALQGNQIVLDAPPVAPGY